MCVLQSLDCIVVTALKQRLLIMLFWGLTIACIFLCVDKDIGLSGYETYKLDIVHPSIYSPDLLSFVF